MNADAMDIVKALGHNPMLFFDLYESVALHVSEMGHGDSLVSVGSSIIFTQAPPSTTISTFATTTTTTTYTTISTSIVTTTNTPATTTTMSTTPATNTHIAYQNVGYCLADTDNEVVSPRSGDQCLAACKTAYPGSGNMYVEYFEDVCY